MVVSWLRYIRSVVCICAVTSAACAVAKQPSSAVFCREQGHSRSLFAAQRISKGDLKFGLSIWDANGQNFMVFGMAKPTRAGWIYEDREGHPAKLVCRLRIDWR